MYATDGIGNGGVAGETLSEGVRGCASVRERRGAWPHLSRGVAVQRVRWLLTLSLSAFGVAGAQPAPASPPLTTEAGTRAELLELLRRVDTQLAEITGSEEPDRQRLLELKGQFEVLLLQAELEALRRENTDLREQQGTVVQGSDGAAEGQGDAEPQTEISGMQRQFTQLGEQQANVSSQLETIASQHALLLEQLSNAAQDTAAQPANAQGGQSPREQAELSELRSRFARLNAQQDVVNAQLQTLTDEHAALLGQIGSAAPDTAATDTAARPASGGRTYVVRPGDSLSELAEAYYGSGTRWPEIAQANPFLTDPDQLFAGTVLVIP